MHLGEIIKKYRQDNYMSMDEFARLSGLSKAYISMLERNKNSRSGKEIVPSTTTIAAVARVIGTTLGALLDVMEDETRISLVPTPEEASAVSKISSRAIPQTVSASDTTRAEIETPRSFSLDANKLLDIYEQLDEEQRLRLTIFAESMLPYLASEDETVDSKESGNSIDVSVTRDFEAAGSPDSVDAAASEDAKGTENSKMTVPSDKTERTN